MRVRLYEGSKDEDIENWFLHEESCNLCKLWRKGPVLHPHPECETGIRMERLAAIKSKSLMTSYLSKAGV